MGPTNVALVKLFEADTKLRDAQARLESAAHNVRIQERRVNDWAEKLRLSTQGYKEASARAAQIDLELKARDAHIEKLRNQQQTAKNNKEYQALLIEINTRKVDKTKIEEQGIANLDAGEKLKAEVANATTQLEGEKQKLAAMRAEINDRLSALQAEVDAIKPERDAAAATLPPKVRDIFNRLADRYDGEAMAGIDRPDRRKEEYLCTACNMDLVRDIYNKLKSRDDVVFCPNCQRILFIPEHFTAEHAIGGPGKTTVKKPKTTVVRSKGAVKKKPAATEASAENAGSASAPSEVVVEIEARATGVLGKALAEAQAESVKRAIAADQNAIEFEVHVDGKLAGIYKGNAADTLERAAKFFLNQYAISYTTLLVKPVAAEATPSTPEETRSSAGEGGETPAASDTSAPAAEVPPTGDASSETANDGSVEVGTTQPA